MSGALAKVLVYFLLPTVLFVTLSLCLLFQFTKN